MTEELVHVRCVTCGKVIGNKWKSYKEKLSRGVHPGKALDELGLRKYCCRMRLFNPAKIPSRFDKQTNFVESETHRPDLSVASGSQPVLSPLQSMAAPTFAPKGIAQTTDYTIVPNTGTEIGLPDIPNVELPAMPSLGGSVDNQKPGQITRMYHAW